MHRTGQHTPVGPSPFGSAAGAAEASPALDDCPARVPDSPFGHSGISTPSKAMESKRVSGSRKILWTQLFTEHHVSLSGYFRRRIADRGDAEDLAQEVYLRLLRTDAGEYREIQNPEAYLYTVAVNLAREHAAARSRAPFATDDIDRIAEVVADERAE